MQSAASGLTQQVISALAVERARAPVAISISSDADISSLFSDCDGASSGFTTPVITPMKAAHRSAKSMLTQDLSELELPSNGRHYPP